MSGGTLCLLNLINVETSGLLNFVDVISFSNECLILFILTNQNT